jgi:hypothetical protein
MIVPALPRPDSSPDRGEGFNREVLKTPGGRNPCIKRKDSILFSPRQTFKARSFDRSAHFVMTGFSEVEGAARAKTVVHGCLKTPHWTELDAIGQN